MNVRLAVGAVHTDIGANPVTAPSRRAGKASAHTATIGDVDWLEVCAGLWIGRRGSEFAGMIESTPDGYTATSDRNICLGMYSTLAEAGSHFADWATDDGVAAPLGIGHRTREQSVLQVPITPVD